MDYFAHAPGQREYLLYARDVQKLANSLGARTCDPALQLIDFARYGELDHDVVINFVGAGTPERTLQMGSAILDATHVADTLVLRSLALSPHRLYLFISSGAVYGDNFELPVDERSASVLPVNSSGAQHCYAAAKLAAEVRHRTFDRYRIVDLRVFNYFSRTQDLSSRFLIAEALACVRANRVFSTPATSFHRDYIAPSDLWALIEKVISGPTHNGSIDAYSLAPCEKFELLDALKARFGLRYERSGTRAPNVTGLKSHYFSLDRRAHRIFGYVPLTTSIQAVLAEAEAVLAAY